jgi:hypothetical protein
MIEHLVGGHIIWDHANAIKKLALLEDEFYPSFFVYDINHSAEVSDALTIFKKEGMQATDEQRMMREYLTSLAVKGFSVAPETP